MKILQDIRMKSKLLFLFLLLNVHLLFAQNATRNISRIDVSKNYPRKSITLQDIADVEYVSLETSDNVLLDGNCNISHVSDNYIVISNPLQGDVFLFGRNGKIKHQFNHRGEGPMDYLNADRLIWDEKNKEIFIYSRKTTPVFLVYSEDGTYKRTISFPVLGVEMIEVTNFDDENILIYEQKMNDDRYEKSPYMLLSKKDGKSTSILFTFPIRYSHTEIVGSWDSDGKFIPTRARLASAPNNWHDGQDFIIADISCDTIFQLKRDQSLIPLLIRTPSVHKTEPKIFLTSILKTEKFILLNKTTMWIRGSNGGYEKNTLMYNFSNGEINGEINEVHNAMLSFFLNDDFPYGPVHWQEKTSAPKNTLFFKIEAMDVYDNRNSIKGDLRKIASAIDTEDNPVLMIAKFR